MPHPQLKVIFESGSTTYFWASQYFPTEIRKDVTRLYAFVRVADNYVDQEVQDYAGLEEFIKEYKDTLAGSSSDKQVISQFTELVKRKQINPDWVQAFFQAMKTDVGGFTCQTLNDTIQYMYGSAEVIGLMMSQILDLPQESHAPAQMLGRAMQYANFIRDIDEDNSLNRQYLPISELKKHGLRNLRSEHVQQHPQEFQTFIHNQIAYYKEWQEIAETGYKYIPKRCLIPIKTAADMYTWTVNQIAKNPTIVYRKKVKPTKSQIIAQALKNHL